MIICKKNHKYTVMCLWTNATERLYRLCIAAKAGMSSNMTKLSLRVYANCADQTVHRHRQGGNISFFTVIKIQILHETSHMMEIYMIMYKINEMHKRKRAIIASTNSKGSGKPMG